jgi:hypothetical protein
VIAAVQGAQMALPLDLPLPTAPPAQWVPLPRGLVPALPDEMDLMSGSLARQDVLAAARSEADAARQLLRRGLAVPAGRRSDQPALQEAR